MEFGQPRFQQLKRAEMRIVRLATVPFFLLHHLRSQIDASVAAGHDVVLISSPIDGAEGRSRSVVEALTSAP